MPKDCCLPSDAMPSAGALLMLQCCIFISCNLVVRFVHAQLPKGQAAQRQACCSSCRTQLAVHVLSSGPTSQVGSAAVEDVEALLCSSPAWETQPSTEEPSSSQCTAEGRLGPEVLDRCAIAMHACLKAPHGEVHSAVGRLSSASLLPCMRRCCPCACQ